MKNNKKSGIPKKIRNGFLNKKFMFYACCILSLLFSNIIKAQNSPLYLTWDHSVGCQVSNNRDLKTYFELIAAGECLRVCQGSTITYTLQESNSTWNATTWNILGGQILSSSTTSCTVKWSNGGTNGSIGASLTTSSGVVILPNLCVELIKKPKARFGKAPFNFSDWDKLDISAPISVCQFEVINFANGSISNGGTSLIDYHWDFGDGTTSTAFEPSHSYPAAGSYTVTLTVTNACNCQGSFSMKVEVGKKGVSIICPAVVCEGQKATYTLTDDFKAECGNFNWSVIGGHITTEAPYGGNIEIDWSAPVEHRTIINDGFGYVTFNPEGCAVDCYVATTIKIPIIKNHMPITGDIVVCGKTQQRYSLPKWPTTDFNWVIDNGGGTNASVIYTDQRNEIILEPGDHAGVITLKAIYQNTLLNCGGTAELKITIKNDAVITGPLEICAGSGGSYSLADEMSGTWSLKKLPSGPTTSFTGSTFNTVFTAAGTYSLTVSGANYCSGKTMFIKVKSSVTPLDAQIMGSRIVCPSSPSTFTITNTVPDTVIGWSIPAGTGIIVGSNYGNEVQVIFYYPIPVGASYSLTVWRENVGDPICRSADLVIPLAPEVLSLAIAGERFPCGSTYWDYEVPETTGDVYVWSISPSEAGTITTNGSRHIQVLWNQFSAPKTAILKLIVTKCNIPQSNEINVLIANPQINIVAPVGPVCWESPQFFHINTNPVLNGASGTPTWNFGDGTTDTGSNVYHTFHGQSAMQTHFNVTVTVQHPNSCLETISAVSDVIVEASPLALLSQSSVVVCNEALVNFTLTATPVAGYPVTSIVWYNGAAALTTLGAYTPSITVTGYGTYYAIVSNGTCSRSTAGCVVGGCGTPCGPPHPLTVSLSNDCGIVSATGGYLGSPSSFGWNSDVPAQSSTNTTAIYDYNRPGNHRVTYTVGYPGETCAVSKTENIFVPYLARVSYSVSCDSGGYVVKLLDTSYVDPAALVDIWEFKVNGIIQPRTGSDLVNDRTIHLAPGTYTILLTIKNNNYPACFKDIQLVLPALPAPAFSFVDNVCQGSATQFTVTNTPLTGLTFSWDFGDLAHNLQQNPDREYNGSGIFHPVLTETNQFGCSVSTSPLAYTVNIRRNDQKGNIVTPALACPGSSTNLHFNSTGSPVSTTYQWLYNNLPIAGATINDYPATQSGSYSVIVGNPNGCTKRIAQSVPVAIVKPPFITINGPTYCCVGQPVTFFVNPGAGSTMLYQWTRDDIGTGFIFSTQPRLDLSAGLTAYPGVYHFTLEVKTPKGGGGYCTSTLTHQLTVVAPPVMGTPTFVVDCSPYKVTLHAQADTSDGVFNWSDGQTGADITEDQGGVYEVTYTNIAGCTVSAQVNVPKSPENYMWIFPSGCYTFCSKFDTGTLIGPAIDDFDDWQWQQNGEVVSEFHGNVPAYNLPSSSATYNLLLQSGDCPLTSPDMTVNVINCDCKVDATLLDNKYIEEGYIHYLLKIFIANTSGADMVVIVSTISSVGVITPGTVTVPDGGGSFDFILIPADGTNGGPINIKLNSSNKEDHLCQGSLHADLYQVGEGGATRMNPKNLVGAGSSLVLVPNPVKDQVQLQFDYGIETAGDHPVIEIYDLLGRLLESYVPQSQKDNWNLNMAKYQAGQYIVVMKINGSIVQQKNLILTH